MKRTKIQIEKDSFPDAFLPLIDGADVYDSSCSPEARVYFIDRDGGYYLKVSPKGTLKREAELDAYFHGKGLGARVLEYLSEDFDYLLTEKVCGEDCCDALYLADPARLCDTVAGRLRALHELDFSDCPVKNRTAEYLETVHENYKKGQYDLSYLPSHMRAMSIDEAYAFVKKNAHLLKADTLLHGDYCLPNIMLDGWCFSGFIDLGNGGVGDRHIDLFWGAWTLGFNLKTDKYRDRFFDAYGRDKVELEKIDLVSACEVFG